MASKSSASAATWANAEVGGLYWGMKFYLLVHRLLGRTLFSVFMVPALMFYFLYAKRARNASQDYLKTLHAFDAQAVEYKKPSLWLSFRHFYQFTQVILDKLLAWASGVYHHNVTFPNKEVFRGAMANGRNGIIVTSHFGNIEACQALSENNDNVRLNALYHTVHNRKFCQLIEEIGGDRAVRFIEVTSINGALAMELAEKVQQGEWICIMGDRIPPFGDSDEVGVDVQFLGRTVKLPIGPYILASILKCPLYRLNCVPDERSRDDYYIDFELLADEVRLDRNNRTASVREYAQAFAHKMEKQCQMRPLQWFNFFPYWDQ